MKRKLLRQIATEWRSNLWLATELLVVSVVMWYVTDYLAVQATIVNIPMGMETDNCFRIDFVHIPPDNENYSPEDSTNASTADGHRTIIDRLRSHPDVEAVGMMAFQAVPYTQNTNYMTLTEVNNPDTLISSWLSWRAVSPDYIRLFRIRGTHGESPDEIASILESGDYLLSDQNTFFYEKKIATDTTITEEQWTELWRSGIDADKSYLVGRSFIVPSRDDSIPHRIGAIVNSIKRLEYETPNGGVITPLSESNDDDVLSSLLAVRVKPEARHRFARDILDKSSTLYHAGNSFISSVVAFDTLRENVQSRSADNVRNFVVIMLFLMASIFLGLLGTFWFRTQQRVSEIAIRMVNGATRASVFRRLIGEGMLLLTAVTPVALLCDWLICHFELSNSIYGWDYFSPGRFAFTVALTYLLMSLMIVLGIWFPALRAMRTEPAVALKDE